MISTTPSDPLPPRRQRVDVQHPSHSDVDDPDEIGRPAQEIAVPRRLAGTADEISRRAALAGDHGRLEYPHQLEVDGIRGHRHLRRGGVGQPSFGFAPVAEERVTESDPDDRCDPDVLQGGREQHRGVEAGADAIGENVAGRTDLLAVAPARRWLGVEDLSIVDRGEDRADDLVDPLRLGVVDAERPAAGGLCQQLGCFGDQRRQRRVIGLDEGRQELEGQHWRVRFEGPLAGGEHADRMCRRADRVARCTDLYDDLGSRLLLHSGQVGGVEPQGGLLDGQRSVGLETLHEVLPGATEHGTEGIDQPSRGEHLRQRLAGGDGDPVEERQTVVCHRLIHLGRGEYLDAHRHTDHPIWAPVPTSPPSLALPSLPAPPLPPLPPPFPPKSGLERQRHAGGSCRLRPLSGEGGRTPDVPVLRGGVSVHAGGTLIRRRPRRSGETLDRGAGGVRWHSAIRGASR